MTLRCPKCGASNRPGATYIEIDKGGTQAYCIVCAHTFHPKKD
jgi:hypothetical protein